MGSASGTLGQCGGGGGVSSQKPDFGALWWELGWATGHSQGTGPLEMRGWQCWVCTHTHTEEWLTLRMSRSPLSLGLLICGGGS